MLKNSEWPRAFCTAENDGVVRALEGRDCGTLVTTMRLKIHRGDRSLIIN